MSEYEAIIFLKNIVKQNGDLDAYTTVPFYKKEAQAIETILDLYKKEKEKNKELENADLTIVYMNGFYEGENKWKDKIKAKIYQLNTSDILEDQIAIPYLKKLVKEE